MSNQLRSLDRITIPTPCNADWDSMTGNDQVRFCEHCNLHVNNLSSMTRLDAMRLVARSQGRLCVRYIQTLDGGVLTKGVPEKLHRISRRVSRIAAGAFTASLSLTSAAAQSGSGQQQSALRQEPAIVSATSPELGAILSGVITDPNGAVVLGAILTLTNTRTNIAFTYITGDDGAYRFSLLEAGPYSLVVEAPSFVKREMPELELKANSDRTVNLSMEIPALTAQVEINADTQVTVVATMGVVGFSEPEDPLVKAAFKNDLDAVKRLVLASPDVNVSDGRANATALAYATEHGNRDMVRVLLSAGADINARNRNGQTALMYLTENASADLVRDFLSAGADVNARNDAGETALIKAASSSDFATVRELINAGARIDLKDDDGTTVLMRAAENGDARLIRLLIGAGVDVTAKNQNEETALTIAVRSERPGSVRVLIELGANLNDRGKDGKTVLMFAASNQEARIAKILIEAGADISAKDDDGNTSLMIAAEDGKAATVKALIDAGADVNAKDEDGQTALMRANDLENVLVLLKAGSDATIKDNKGQTALSIARKSEQAEIVKLLKSRGAPE